MAVEHQERGGRLRLYVSGEFRWMPAEWWDAMEGPRPPYTFRNDGCTASPDYTTTDEVLWPACVIHDYHYGHGPALSISRWEADAIFRRNVKRLLRLQGVGWFRRQWYGWTRWIGVRKLGEGHYGG